ncbi:MAG TPA: hypothetical protein VM053_03775 [Gemmatimonadaceae bacterium]|nr:hypothetical protein [Gemmatimonadaceae bacterium]
MTKSKTNALESLRALIAERQQYEQWITTLESKRDGTPAHVFERVQGDYNTRLERVIGDIKGHAEELQLSITALSSRLVEVAREEDTRRDALQEAELRATVGEYEPQQWQQLKSDADQALEKIAADRASLDSQLGELRSIQKLSEVGSTGSGEDVGAEPPAEIPEEALTPVATAQAENPAIAAPDTPELTSTYAPPPPSAPDVTPTQYSAPRDQGHFPLEDAAAASAAVLSSPPPVPTPQPAAPQPSSSGDSRSTPSRPRSGKTPPFGGVAARPKPPESRTDQAKTLKCPECGTPNYPTEWYCERCGGELATM